MSRLVIIVIVVGIANSKLLDRHESSMHGGAASQMHAAASSMAGEPAQAGPVLLMRRDVGRLQHPGRCTDPALRFLVFQYDEEDDINGFGAMFQFLASALAIAHGLNRTLVESVPTRRALQGTYDTWLRAPDGDCFGLKAGCYFDHISSCVYTGDVSTLPQLDPSLATQSPRFIGIRRMAVYASAIKAATRGDFAPDYWRTDWCKAWGVVGSMSSSSCWRALWYPTLQEFLFRPRAPIRLAAFSGQGQDMSFDVGVHVRRGDALTLDWRSHAGVPEYAAACSKMLSTLALSDHSPTRALSVYIATDSTDARIQLGTQLRTRHKSLTVLASSAVILQSSTVLADGSRATSESSAHTESVLKQLASAEGKVQRRSLQEEREEGVKTGDTMAVAGASVLVVHGRRRSETDDRPVHAIMSLVEWCMEEVGNTGTTDGCSGPIDTASASDSYRLTAGVISDIWALSHAHALVGTCLSQVSRMAYDLQVATGRARIQAVAMDQAACAAFPHDISLLLPWRGDNW